MEAVVRTTFWGESGPGRRVLKGGASRPVSGGTLGLGSVQRNLRLLFLRMRSLRCHRGSGDEVILGDVGPECNGKCPESGKDKEAEQRPGWCVCKPRSVEVAATPALGARPSGKPGLRFWLLVPELGEDTGLLLLPPQDTGTAPSPLGAVSASGTGHFWAAVQSAGGWLSLCDGTFVTPASVWLPL